MDGLKAFKYVITIANFGSVSEAAKTLGIAQSALSRYILKLEKELGAELFDRTMIPIIPTEAGRYFVEAGKQILDMYRQLEKRIESVKLNKNSEVRIGTGPSRSSVLMPLILKKFSSQYPDVRILTEEYRTAELAERLSDGKLDMVITFLDQSTENFGVEYLFDERVYLAVPSGFLSEVQPIIENGQIDVGKVSVPFVSLHEGQQLRNALDILTQGSVKPLYDSNYLETAMALVKNGFGVTLAPSYWRLVDAGDEAVSYFPIAVPNYLEAGERERLLRILNRKIGIFYRKEQFLSEAEKAYIMCAKEVCRDINDM